MKTTLAQLMMCIALLCAATVPVGCKSTPNAIAYKASAATVATVDASMRAWADYVVATRRLNEASDNEKGKADLLRREYIVRSAFARYQEAVTAASVGVATASGVGFAPNVAGAAAALLSVIQSETQH